MSCMPPKSQMDMIVGRPAGDAVPGDERDEDVHRHGHAQQREEEAQQGHKRMGLLEKEVMPSMAKATIFLSGYLDSPATRARRARSRPRRS